MPHKIEEKKQIQKSRPQQMLKTRVNGRHHEDDVSRFSVTINASSQEVFAYFRDFSKLPTFMKDLKDVQVLTAKRSHWKVELKNGLSTEWEVEITAEREGEMIAWKSVEGSSVESSGTAWFSPAPEALGTVVGLVLEYKVPGGKLTEFVTKLTGEDPSALIQINLKRLKAMIETGEIATVEGQTSGREEGAESIVTH